jgi:hypothetical protein
MAKSKLKINLRKDEVAWKFREIVLNGKEEKKIPNEVRERFKKLLLRLVEIIGG